jgi:hypothetical protein
VILIKELKRVGDPGIAMGLKFIAIGSRARKSFNPQINVQTITFAFLNISIEKHIHQDRRLCRGPIVIG